MSDERPPWETSPDDEELAPWETPRMPQERTELEPTAQEPEAEPSARPREKLPLAARLMGMVPQSIQRLVGEQSATAERALGIEQEPQNVIDAAMRAGVGTGINEGIGALKGVGQLLAGAYEVPRWLARKAGVMEDDEAPSLTDLVAGARRKRTLSERIRGTQEAIGATPKGPIQGLGALAAKAIPAAATGGSSLVGQMGAGAALSGGQTLLEGGSPTEVGVSTVLGGAAPGAGKLVGTYGKHLGKSAVDLYEKALHATRKPLKETSRKIVPELLKRRVYGSLEKLTARGAAESEKAGAGLAETYAKSTAAGKTLDKKSILREIDNLKAEFLGRADKAAMSEAFAGERNLRRLSPEKLAMIAEGKYVRNPQAVKAVDALRRRVEMASADPEELWKLRREFDNIVGASGWRSGLDRGSQKAIARDARTVLQRELDKAHPSIRTLNKEYGLWQGLEDVAGETALRKTGQQNAPGMVARAAGAVVGAAVPGGPATKAAAAIGTSKVAALLEKTFRSPGYRTWSAVRKAKLRDLILEGNADKIAEYVLRAAGPVEAHIAKPDMKRDVEAKRRRRAVMQGLE